MKPSRQIWITAVLVLVVMWLLPSPWFYLAGSVAVFLSYLAGLQREREQRK